MTWKTKALIQRACASLPVGSEAAYYFLQKNLGSLRFAPDPMPNLRDLADIAKDLAQAGFSIAGKRVMEVGTGRRIDMPVGLYLLGASSVETYDLHPYMKAELVEGSLAGMLRNRDEIAALLGPIAGRELVEARLATLAKVRTARELMDASSIHYHAPADAAKTGLPDGSIDLQFSFTVFEHIPGPVLSAILKEASRVLVPETGLACHHIDPSDHFAHDDQSISFVNFLQFEEIDWAKYNDNQFAYHNRLRVDDYEKIYREAGHEAVLWRTWKNDRAMKELSEGTLPLAARYRGVAADTLGTTAVRAITKARRA